MSANLSKVYKGFVIQQTTDGQWVIQNFPTWTNVGAISPGPHSSWTVATHQVDRLLQFASK